MLALIKCTSVLGTYLLWAALVADIQRVLCLVSVSPGQVNLNLSLGALGSIDGLDLLLPGSGWWLESLLLWGGAASDRLAGRLGLLGGSWSADVGLATTLLGLGLAAPGHDLRAATKALEVLLDNFTSGPSHILVIVAGQVGLKVSSSLEVLLWLPGAVFQLVVTLPLDVEKDLAIIIETVAENLLNDVAAKN